MNNNNGCLGIKPARTSWNFTGEESANTISRSLLRFQKRPWGMFYTAIEISFLDTVLLNSRRTHVYTSLFN